MCIRDRGMIATGFVTSEAMLLITYGLGVGLGVGMVYGCTITNTIKFFPDKKLSLIHI